jgi:CheY-like chemotaxis protein
MDALRQSLARGEARSEGLAGNARPLLAGAGAAFLLMLAVTIGAGLLTRRYMQALEAAQAEVTAANASLGERVGERAAALTATNNQMQRFAYIVSHDLRYAVATAADGPAGLVLVVGGGFDAICLDHYMPGQDGPDTIAQLRQLAERPPIIYVTGSDEGRIAVAA